MSAVRVIRYLLANYAPLTAIVDASKIKAGTIPLSTVLPAISLIDISGQRRNTVSMTEETRLVTSRVQVTPLVNTSKKGGTDYDGMVTILGHIMTACANQSGTVNGVAVDSILPDTRGPNLEDEDSGIMEQGQDFIVKHQE